MQKDKTDAVLGRRVQEHLVSLGLHTPTTDLVHNDYEGKIKTISNHMSEIMQVLGLDVTDDSLIDTPKRVAKMWVKEKFWGLDPALFPKVTTIENKMHYDEMLIENDVTVMSDCEHHWVAITGLATVAYSLKKKVIGLS